MDQIDKKAHFYFFYFTNSFLRTLDDEQRTNNWVEGWHNGFKSKIQDLGKNPLIQKFILELHKENIKKQRLYWQ